MLNRWWLGVVSARISQHVNAVYFHYASLGEWARSPSSNLLHNAEKPVFPQRLKGVFFYWKKKKKFQENDSVHFSSVNWMVQFSSVAQSCLLLCDPWTAAGQASLSITNSHSLLKLMSLESVVPSNHLILCHPLLLPSSIFPSIRVFSNNRGHIDKCMS